MTTKIFLEQIAQIGYLFANCDGKFERKEKEAILSFIQKMKEHGIKDEDVEELASKDYSHITLSEVVQTVENSTQDLGLDDKKKYFNGLTEFIEELIKIDGVIAPEEKDLLERWKDAISEILNKEKIINTFQNAAKPEFEERTFWQKLGEFAKKAGLKVIYAALLLYYVMVAKSTSAKDKALIAGALAYLVSPVDIIPDGIPVVGFADDLVVLLYVLKTVRENVTDEIKAQAKTKLGDWFKKIDEKELAEVL